MAKETEIFAWCPTCMGEDKHVEKMTIVNNGVVMKLACGHTVRERFID